MNFYIKQHSNLPVLSVELVENGIDSYKKFYENLEDAVITFFMEEVNSCIPILQCKECCLTSEASCADCPDKLYIQYKWQASDTSKKGKYRGWFEILFNETENVLIVPIKEELFINII